MFGKEMREKDDLSRKIAKAMGRKRYYTGNLCPYGHDAERYTSNGRCTDCAYISYEEWTKLHPEKFKESRDKSYLKNRDKSIAKCKIYYHENKQYFYWSHRRWMEDNERASKLRSLARQRRLKYATPQWANRDEIKKIYMESYNMTKKTGIKHHVDHMEPVNGRDRCGLHVHWNLQVLTATENLAKKNKVINVK